MVKVNVDSLRFAYRKYPVLKDVTFQSANGTVLCLVGPNGSGKTTLIRCIDRILEPEGSVFIDGKNIRDMHRKEIAKIIGYVPQTGSKIISTTVFDVVMMGRNPHMGWQAGEEDFVMVEEAIQLLEIQEIAERQYNELSGGQQQKVLIARAVAQNPQVLLLDEPTNNLDIRHQLEAVSIIHKLSREKEITVIMAIHDLNIAARYADKLMMLKDGNLVAIGNPADLVTKERIREVYGVETKIIQDPEAGLIITPLRPITGV
ncbi:MAG: ABC transporter ATP-binding protein [Methanomethylovorans sp.]|nr:ABC transporter ATP-binding protein [Methanomethylovorans sp.]